MKHLNFKNLFSLKRHLNLMVIAITIVFLFSFVSPAFCGGAQAADTGLKETADKAGLPTSGDLTTIIGQIIYTILGFLGVAFVILVLYGGAKRMFAKGDSKQITDSNGIITSAVVGVAIILLSYIITAFVISQVKSNIGAGSDTTYPVSGEPRGAELPSSGCTQDSDCSCSTRLQLPKCIISSGMCDVCQSVQCIDASDCTGESPIGWTCVNHTCTQGN